MRSQVTADSARELARALGRVADQPTRVYLVGGATAVIEGWRESTVDVDIRIEPAPQVLREIPALRERLGVNIEFASPADFLPELPQWRDRSPFLFREEAVDIFHYDLYSQALAKLERGPSHDVDDVAAMISSGAVLPGRLAELLQSIVSGLYRFPAVDPDTLAASVSRLARR